MINNTKFNKKETPDTYINKLQIFSSKQGIKILGWQFDLCFQNLLKLLLRRTDNSKKNWLVACCKRGEDVGRLKGIDNNASHLLLG